MRDLLFYDIECFPQDSLVTILDSNGEPATAPLWNITRDDGTHPFDDIPPLLQNHTMVGYNNFHYDDLMLTQMMREPCRIPEVIFATNNSIIGNGASNGLYKSDLIESIDTMQQIEISLKRIEANMGLNIFETPIDFTHAEKLTAEERAEVEKYCRADVLATIEVYKARKVSYFETKETLVDMVCHDFPKLNKNDVMRWNTTTIAAYFLTGTRKANTRFLPFPDKVRDMFSASWIPDKVRDMWADLVKDIDSVTGKGKNVKLNLWDCEVTYGMGGLHGAPKKPGRYTDIKLADVGSMYPSIMCSLKLLGDATEKYDGIRQERLRIKKTDKTRANALKLVLNSVYGLLKMQYSALYNPYISATVCIYGQIVITKLCQDLYDAGFRLVNINTDGVAFDNPKNLPKETYETIIHDWEDLFKGMTLEVDEFDTWVQKDVNNYVATQGDHIKVKGGEVKKYAEDNLFSDNSCRITHIAIVEKLLHNVNPMDTIRANRDNLKLYQFVLHAGSTFKGTVDADGNMQQKVNRVFAVKESAPHTTLYKLRPDGGRVKFADAPECMQVYNDRIMNFGSSLTEQEERDLDRLRKNLDVSYYTELVESKLKGWPS